MGFMVRNSDLCIQNILIGFALGPIKLSVVFISGFREGVVDRHASTQFE